MVGLGLGVGVGLGLGSGLGSAWSGQRNRRFGRACTWEPPYMNLFFFYPPADGEKYSFRSSPHVHVFSYASCVDLTQLLSQPNAS